MNTHRIFKIVVLEDNDFYNNLLTHKLQNYLDQIGKDKGLRFEIQSYTNASDCMRNFKPETDIIVSDYYLGDGANAIDIIKQVRKINDDCKMIVISTQKNIKTSYQTLNEGACYFVFKDAQALDQCCILVEEIINEKFLTDSAV